MQYDPTNPWHRVPVGENAPNLVNGIIEIPRGERAKYELDKTTGMLKLDRVIYSSMHYPANYGFIPQTYCDDDDPLDIMVLTQARIVPMCLVSCKVIGVMRMLDGGELDDKIIAVAENDMSVNHYGDISELPPHFRLELQTFFEDYKKLEKKAVVIEEFLGAETAKEIVVKAVKDYQQLMGFAQL